MVVEIALSGNHQNNSFVKEFDQMIRLWVYYFGEKVSMYFPWKCISYSDACTRVWILVSADWESLESVCNLFKFKMTYVQHEKYFDSSETARVCQKVFVNIHP